MLPLVTGSATKSWFLDSGGNLSASVRCVVCIRGVLVLVLVSCFVVLLCLCYRLLMDGAYEVWRSSRNAKHVHVMRLSIRER
jgi:hypothetical protein